MIGRTRKWSATLLAIALLGGCGGRQSADTSDLPPSDGSKANSPRGYTVVDVANGGTITGSVTLRPESNIPPGFQSPTTQDVCSGVEANNRLVPGPGRGVPWAIVRIRDIKSGKDFGGTAGGSIILDQKQCQYLPHLVAARIGSGVAIRNLDPVPHNVRIEDPRNDSILMNLVQPTTGRVDSFRVDRAGALLVKFDYHPWMNAYLFGVDNPYFSVTAPDGAFSIDGIPPGSYTLELWMNGP
jgi:hypothetical protein